MSDKALKKLKRYSSKRLYSMLNKADKSIADKIWKVLINRPYFGTYTKKEGEERFTCHKF